MGSVWLTRCEFSCRGTLKAGGEVFTLVRAGSIPVHGATIQRLRGVAQWQSAAFGALRQGSDSPHSDQEYGRSDLC